MTGVVFIAHGWPKLFGGVPETAQFLESLAIPLPLVVAWAIALVETLGGLMLVVGYWVTPAAAALGLHMTAGIFLVHLPNGFFVVGPGQNGIEFNLVLLAALLAVVFVGPGHWTLESRSQKDITIA